MSELHFQASPHVQHMRAHGGLYTATIAAFLADLPPANPLPPGTSVQVCSGPVTLHLHAVVAPL